MDPIMCQPSTNLPILNPFSTLRFWQVSAGSSKPRFRFLALTICHSGLDPESKFSEGTV
jgi:hypothetical protein